MVRAQLPPHEMVAPQPIRRRPAAAPARPNATTLSKRTRDKLIAKPASRSDEERELALAKMAPLPKVRRRRAAAPVVPNTRDDSSESEDSISGSSESGSISPTRSPGTPFPGNPVSPFPHHVFLEGRGRRKPKSAGRVSGSADVGEADAKAGHHGAGQQHPRKRSRVAPRPKRSACPEKKREGRQQKRIGRAEQMVEHRKTR